MTIGGEGGMGPEFEASEVEQVKSIAREFVKGLLADPGADRGILMDQMRVSIEAIAPKDTLARDARSEYALAMALCELAWRDEAYEDDFWDAYENLDRDQSLAGVLSDDEKRAYERKIDEVKSGIEL